jgi:nicotinate-nucleotide--dimethylbenzimidazole phosphoribosyltransferase
MMNNNLTTILRRARPVNAEWLAQAAARQLTLTKPPGSLGRLEEIANRLCAIQETLKPQAEPARVVVFAAEHGVTEEGVSPYPTEVTAQMAANFCAGGAAINALAGVAGASVCVVNVGLATPFAPPDAAGGASYVHAPVAPGSRNFTRGPAMTDDELKAALQIGFETAAKAAQEGVKVLALGEMGIGNTTAASALTAVLCGLPPAAVTGRGTGADDAMLRRKTAAIERALQVNQPAAGDPLGVLRKVGGLEIAALCGLCLGAAAERIAIVTDGFIATAGAALATRLCPAVADYTFASHLSAEPGHAALLSLINHKPLLDLGLRLGEGTGAALALPLLQAAAAAFNQMATFSGAGVSNAENTAA